MQGGSRLSAAGESVFSAVRRRSKFYVVGITLKTDASLPQNPF